MATLLQRRQPKEEPHLAMSEGDQQEQASATLSLHLICWSPKQDQKLCLLFSMLLYRHDPDVPFPLTGELLQVLMEGDRGGSGGQHIQAVAYLARWFACLRFSDVSQQSLSELRRGEWGGEQVLHGLLLDMVMVRQQLLYPAAEVALLWVFFAMFFR